MGFERRLAGPLALVLSLSLLSSPTRAEPSAAAKETARSLMDDGDKKMASGDLRAALKSYQAADDIMRVPTTALEVARTQIKLGLLVEARDTLQRLIRIPVQPKEPGAFARARSEAKEIDDQLQKRIPSLKVSVQGLAAGAVPEVTIDGEAIPATAIGLPRKINPGPRRIVASARGYESASNDLTLADGDNREITLTLKPLPGTELPPPATTAPAATTAPPPPPPPSTAPPAPTAPPQAGGLRKPVLVYGGFGLGALGIATGGISGLVALSNASSAKSKCDGDRCPEVVRGDIVASKNWALASNIGFAVGIVGAGIGLVALVASSGSSSASRRPAIEPLIGLNQAGIRGQF